MAHLSCFLERYSAFFFPFLFWGFPLIQVTKSKIICQKSKNAEQMPENTFDTACMNQFGRMEPPIFCELRYTYQCVFIHEQISVTSTNIVFCAVSLLPCDFSFYGVVRFILYLYSIVIHNIYPVV